MKNGVQSGNYLELTAPADVESGAPKKIGALSVVASAKFSNGVKGNWLAEGVVELPVAAGKSFAEGDLVYLTAGGLITDDNLDDFFGIAIAATGADVDAIIKLQHSDS